MCGIIGSINTKWNESPLESLLHRGSDSQGVFKLNNICLGHTRLSIQDLSALGNQPMYSPGGRFVYIFNGELYNHWTIREDLIKKGY